MIDTKQNEIIADVEVKLIKWHQGPLKDYIVEIYKNNKRIFNKEDMTLSEAKKLYKEKVREYELKAINAYDKLMSRVNRIEETYIYKDTSQGKDSPFISFAYEPTIYGDHQELLNAHFEKYQVLKSDVKLFAIRFLYDGRKF